MERLEDLFFYLLDKAIRTHRQYTQNRLRMQGYPITIDQWLLLTAINQNKNLSQADLGAMVFKDKASINRMTDLLIRKGFLQKAIHAVDGRKFEIALTQKGITLLHDIENIVLVNRQLSLEGISEGEVAVVKKTMLRLIDNCNKYYYPNGKNKLKNGE